MSRRKHGAGARPADDQARFSPTVRLRNRILTIVTRSIVEWAYGGQIDSPAINREIDELLDAAFAEDARRREVRRRKQLVELLRSKKK